MGMKPRKKPSPLESTTNNFFLMKESVAEGWIDRDEDTMEKILDKSGIPEPDAGHFVWDDPTSTTEDWPPRKVRVKVVITVEELPWKPPPQDEDDE